MPYNLSKSKLGSEKLPSLTFICTLCNRATHRRVSACLCGNSMFKVARYMPLINYPLDPYRKQNDESGYKLNAPGGNESSVGGAENYQIPTEGGDDDVGTPNANSEDLTQTDAMKTFTKPARDHATGPHSMNANMPTMPPNPNVFIRTKNKLNTNFTGKF